VNPEPTARNAEIFAANRAHGRVDLRVAAADGVTRRTHVREEGALRVRFPNVPAGPAEAVLINTAGGVAGGDAFDMRFTLDAGAALTVTTAAAEKVYRSLGPDAHMTVQMQVGLGAKLCWLPQETILFDRARLSRSIDADLATDASLLLAEAVVFGRAAYGEAVTQGGLSDRWRIRRDGRLVFADTVRLDGPIAARMAERAVAGGGVALATVVMLPGTDAQAAAVRAAAEGCAGEVGVSAWNGLCVARFCAQDAGALRHDLGVALVALGAPLPRLWLN
jgi:urease accessory protein